METQQPRSSDVRKLQLADDWSEMEMTSDGNRVMASWIDELFEETKGDGAKDVTMEDTECGAAGLIDLFHRVDDNMISGDEDDDYEDSEDTSETDEEEGPEPAQIQIDFNDVLVIDEEIVAEKDKGSDDLLQKKFVKKYTQV